MSTTAQTTPPGWYPNGDVMQLWNGLEWTDETRPLPAPAQQPAPAHQPEESAGGIVVVGYITAVLMPLIGFVLGIVVVTRPAKATSKHGAWIIVVSIVAFIVWLSIIVHGSSTGTTY
jgi:uncharacterized membrane protein YhaH (DUF805 family)